jgi:hypothetical protein
MHGLTIYGTPEDQIKFEGELNEEEIGRIETVTLGADTVLGKRDATVDTGTDKVNLTNPVVAFHWILMGSSLVGAE